MTDYALRVTGNPRYPQGAGGSGGVVDSPDLALVPGTVHLITSVPGTPLTEAIDVLLGRGSAVPPIFTLLVDGAARAFPTIAKAEAAGLACVRQEPAVFPYLSVSENLFLGKEKKVRGLVSWRRTRREAPPYLAAVGLDTEPTLPVSGLTHFEQRRLDIAKALARGAEVLFAIEPFAELSRPQQTMMGALLRSVGSHGVAVVVASAEFPPLLPLVDSVTLVDARGAVARWTSQPSAHDVVTAIAAALDDETEAPQPRTEQTMGDETLRVEDWSVTDAIRPEQLRVDGASFSVRKGEILGLAGLPGAGQLELALSVYGRSYGSDSSGSIYRAGREISPRTPQEAIAEGLGYSAEEHLSYRVTMLGGLPMSVSPSTMTKLAAAGIVDGNRSYRTKDSGGGSKFSLADLAGTRSGNQQAALISELITTGPTVLFLREPSRGLDTAGDEHLFRVIDRFLSAGKSVILLSSDLGELVDRCDTVVALAHGRVVGELSGLRSTDRANATTRQARRRESLAELVRMVVSAPRRDA